MDDLAEVVRLALSAVQEAGGHPQPLKRHKQNTAAAMNALILYQGLALIAKALADNRHGEEPPTPIDLRPVLDGIRNAIYRA